MACLSMWTVPADLKAFCDRLDLTGTGVEGVEKTRRGLRGRGGGARARRASRIPIQRPHARGRRWTWAPGEPPCRSCAARRTSRRASRCRWPLVGAVLPGDFKIKKSKLRGVVSCGMCCSKRELGLGAAIIRGHLGACPPMRRWACPSRTIVKLGRHGARPGDHAEPPRLPVHGGHGARGGGHVPAADWTWPAVRRSWRNWLPLTAGEDVAAAVTVEVPDAARCPRYTARVDRQREGGA